VLGKSSAAAGGRTGASALLVCTTKMRTRNAWDRTHSSLWPKGRRARALVRQRSEGAVKGGSGGETDFKPPLRAPPLNFLSHIYIIHMEYGIMG